jgi:hypothetical protein
MAATISAGFLASAFLAATLAYFCAHSVRKIVILGPMGGTGQLLTNDNSILAILDRLDVRTVQLAQ